ncbi:general odorant-binding protein lush [Eupeodes corollae]|uniref:general odorant-binding protein lush n=1 Tax=Eupeodes corollae TaxID=290404 RepID=UPI002492A7B4|nr:general odorant-binding protein lush [Eupeodes corollae]
MNKDSVFWLTSIVFSTLLWETVSVTMKQFESSLDMMRSGCAPKFKVTIEQLDDMRYGKFVENNMELKCYSKCIAQLAGTLTKKGEFSFQKALAQIPIILPPEIQGTAKSALEACKEIQKGYTDTCEKVFYVTKCVHDFDPSSFKFP